MTKHLKLAEFAQWQQQHQQMPAATATISTANCV